MKTILVIDDEKDIRNLITRILQLEGYHVIGSETGRQAIKHLEKQEIPVALVDVKLPDIDGIELIRHVKEIQPETEVICFTAFGNVPDGVKAIKNGAFDYLMKGDDNNKIIPLVAKAFEKATLQLRIKHLEERIQKQHGFENIIGQSLSIEKVIKLAQKVAATDATVLITGDTGTGKELFAHAIHTDSTRSKEPFIALNCSAFSRELMESELFGYRAGAFTGAVRDKKGLIEEAHKGTLFLDEIGEMDPDLQVKLLRVLETGTFIKVGDTKEMTVDVRVIAATNRNLEEEIEKGQFRQDLYYRLCGFSIHLPSLNDRPEDIPMLAEHFTNLAAVKNNKKVTGLSPDFTRLLQQHIWKGNIRELKNVIERAVILADTDEIQASLLPFEFTNASQMRKVNSLTLADVEMSHIRKVLDMVNGNKTRAAKILGIGLTTLYRKLELYGL